MRICIFGEAWCRANATAFHQGTAPLKQAAFLHFGIVFHSELQKGISKIERGFVRTFVLSRDGYTSYANQGFIYSSEL